MEPISFTSAANRNKKQSESKPRVEPATRNVGQSTRWPSASLIAVTIPDDPLPATLYPETQA